MNKGLPVVERAKTLGKTLDAPTWKTILPPPIPVKKKPKGGDYLRRCIWEVGPRQAEEAQRKRETIQKRRMEEAMRRVQWHLREEDARKARQTSLLLDYWRDRSLEGLQKQWNKEEKKEDDKTEKDLGTLPKQAGRGREGSGGGSARGREGSRGGRLWDSLVPITIFPMPNFNINPVVSWSPSLPATIWHKRRSLQYEPTPITIAEELEPLLSIRPARMFPRRPTWPLEALPGMAACLGPSSLWAGTMPQAFQQPTILPPLAHLPSSAAPPDNNALSLVLPTKEEIVQDPSPRPLPGIPR